jgi:hypothetical protein
LASILKAGWGFIPTPLTPKGANLVAAERGCGGIIATLADKLHLRLGDQLIFPSSRGEAALEIVGILKRITHDRCGTGFCLAASGATNPQPSRSHQLWLERTRYVAGSDLAAVQAAAESAMGYGVFASASWNIGRGADVFAQMGETAMNAHRRPLAIIMAASLIYKHPSAR